MDSDDRSVVLSVAAVVTGIVILASVLGIIGKGCTESYNNLQKSCVEAGHSPIECQELGAR